VLAVVENQNLVPLGEGSGQPVKRARTRFGRPPRDDGLADADCLEHRVRDLRRIGHRRQLHEPRDGVQAPAGLGREPGFAHSPGAGQRDQAPGRQVLPHAGYLAVTADEVRQGVRHPAGTGARRRYHGSFGRNKGRITGGGGCLGYGGRPLLAPQYPQIDLFQRGGGNDAPGVKGEQGQQNAQPSPADMDQTAGLIPHLERAQQPDAQRVRHPRLRRP
jgi:hypothetical protein